jgi:hypothetical protein
VRSYAREAPKDPFFASALRKKSDLCSCEKAIGDRALRIYSNVDPISDKMPYSMVVCRIDEVQYLLPMLPMDERVLGRSCVKFATHRTRVFLGYLCHAAMQSFLTTDRPEEVLIAKNGHLALAGCTSRQDV